MSVKENRDKLNRLRIIPNSVKEKISPFITSGSRIQSGLILGLKKPVGFNSISTKTSGVSFGADKNGFFVYTHRARSKSKINPLKITKKEIDFIESTG